MRIQTRRGRSPGARLGLRGAGVMLLVCAVSAPVAAGRGGSAFAPDANAIVRKMVTTYQSAQTVQEATEARVQEIGKQEYIQSGTIKFKRPNYWVMTSLDPTLGSLATYCNTRTITIYSGRQNQFTKRTAPATLTESLKVVRSASRDMLQVPIVQFLNPVTFLEAKGMPREAKSFRYGGAETVEGRKTHRLIGQASSELFARLEENPSMTPRKREIVLWVDASNNLLVKARMSLAWTIALKNNPKRAILAGFTFEEVHRGTALNAPLKDTDFDFVKPRQAKERYQERKDVSR